MCIWNSRGGKVLITDASVPLKGLKFNFVSLVALSINYLVFIIFSRTLPEVSPWLAQWVGIAPAMFINYLLNSYWTFKKNDRTDG